VSWVVVSPDASGGHWIKTDSVDSQVLFHGVDPSTLTGPGDLVDPLRDAGCVARMANSDTWDALATAIVRQVIRAGQARKLYRAFCREHGTQVDTPAGSAWLFPRPETVLALPEAEFRRLGMAFKRRPLHAAALAYLDNAARWAELGGAAETKVGANEAEVAHVTDVASTLTHPRASREGHENLWCKRCSPCPASGRGLLGRRLLT
jgi:hypothetical protein